KAGDANGERIYIDSGCLVEGSLSKSRQCQVRLVPHAHVKQASERIDEKVAGATRRIDQPDAPITELGDGRDESAVEDKSLDEFWRLQQGVALFRGLGEVLVEVAEEPGVKPTEIVTERPTIWIDLLTKLDQRCSTIARNFKSP